MNSTQHGVTSVYVTATVERAIFISTLSRFNMQYQRTTHNNKSEMSDLVLIENII